jgi:hypothetical protein
MRFLLHPRTATAAAARLSQSNLGNVKQKAIISNAANENVVSASSVDTTGVKAQSMSINKSSGTKAWGQQCSPDCGCVVRLCAVIDPETRTFRSASYTAKSIVTVATTTSMCANKNGGQQQQPRLTLQAVLTTKGRPMMKACECKTLHHLSEAIVNHLPNQKVSKIKNLLEFQSTRSSLAFRQTVLTTQELPAQDTHCFDVVEEALTALVKGRIPKPRRKTGQELNKPNRSTHPSRRQWHQDEDNDDDEDALQFGQLWKDYRVDTTMPRAMSTLMMFDTNHHEYNNSKGGGRMSRPLPADWVSYVDEMYNQEEQEERSA